LYRFVERRSNLDRSVAEDLTKDVGHTPHSASARARRQATVRIEPRAKRQNERLAEQMV
jgi:hypothetical protein